MNDVIDVSRYQGSIDWAKVAKADIGGAMLKAISTNKAYGGIYCDPMFEKNYWSAREHNIPVGVYSYTYAQDIITMTAELGKLKEALDGKEFQMPIVIDVEDNRLKKLSTDALTELVEYALKTIESWGLYAMLYTYTSYTNTELDMDKLSAYDLWIADYRGKRPTRKHGMWQYTSAGSVDGINGNVDISHSYKNYPRIIRNNGLSCVRG